MAVQVEIDNMTRLDKLLMSNPDTEKEVRQLVGMVLREAEKEVESAAARAMKNGDYRNTALSVRKAVYRQIIGGNINILSGKRGRNGTRGSVGESTRGRTKKTQAMLGYSDRSFILRWIDAGTNGRVTEYMNGHKILRGSIGERPQSRYFRFDTIGARGKITATNFFGPAAKSAIKKAADSLIVLLEQMFTKEIK